MIKVWRGKYLPVDSTSLVVAMRALMLIRVVHAGPMCFEVNSRRGGVIAFFTAEEVAIFV